MNRDEELYAAAVGVPLPERNGFLDRACADDPALRARLAALLIANDEAESFFASVAPQRPALTADEKPGDRIGRYKLLQKIGEGGCGAVYMAEQEEPVRRRVALKVIKLGMDTKEVVARFEAERQALALMDHPNIARALDAGATEAGRPFFVMELVRGIPITRYCDEESLPAASRLRLFVQVCHAIQHAHEKGIVHRDIKPTNVLVTMHDDVAVPKVIDFGIAKATQGRLTDKTVFTAFEQFIGTPAYMSPEQAQMNDLEVDPRSDIYSLGVLLYELLAGRPPFDPHTLRQSGIDEIRRIIRDVEPSRPSTRFNTLGAEDRLAVARRRGTAPAQLWALVRGDLDWIAMKALEKNRTRRYATASALATDIKRHLNHEPVMARPPSVGYRLQKFAARHRFALLGGVAIVASLGAGLALAKVAWRPDGHRETARPAENAILLGPAAAEAVDIRKLPLKDPRRTFDVSQDGRLIAFAPYGSPNDLAVYDLLGHVTATIVKGTEEDYVWEGACFSPDGRSIAYDRSGRMIYIAKADGSDARLIFTGVRGADDWLWVIGWTPDGRRLIVVRGDATEATLKTCGLGELDVQTGTFREIVRIASGNYRLSPDARYVAVRKGNSPAERTLSLFDLEARRETTLVEREVRDVAGWSPDGTRVLFSSDRTGVSGLWALAVNDGQPEGDVELIKSNMPQTSIVGIDGSGRIYYVEEKNSINVFVMSANFETGEIIRAPRRVMDRFPGEQSLPVWSADGETLLLAIQRGQSRLVLLSPSSGRQADFPLVTDQIQQVAWSEARGFVLFQSNLAGANYGIHRYELASGKIETLVGRSSGANWNAQPELSRDGNAFYYIRREFSKAVDEREEWTDRIMRRDLATGVEAVISAAEKLSIWAPIRLAPDERHLAAATADNLAIKTILLATGESREVVRLTPPQSLRSIAWTPDGKRLVYTSGADIWSVEVASGQPVKLGITQIAIRDVAVHPDGRQIAFRAGRFGAARELWVMAGLLTKSRTGRR